MSNETKREVFEKALRAWDDLVHEQGLQGEESHGACEFDPILIKYKKDYDTALPDDLPVIPEAVSDYIRKTTAPGKNGLIEVFCSLADDIRAVGHDNIYKWDLWMLNNQAAVARAWLLGVWRVEETGEIVKLEAEN